MENPIQTTNMNPKPSPEKGMASLGDEIKKAMDFMTSLQEMQKANPTEERIQDIAAAQDNLTRLEKMASLGDEMKKAMDFITSLQKMQNADPTEKRSKDIKDAQDRLAELLMKQNAIRQSELEAKKAKAVAGDAKYIVSKPKTPNNNVVDIWAGRTEGPTRSDPGFKNIGTGRIDENAGPYINKDPYGRNDGARQKN